jgi:hypothetical protein
MEGQTSRYLTTNTTLSRIVANMNKNSKIEIQSSFEPERAKDVVGKLILIGLTYFDQNGQVTEQKQLYGKITAANKSKISVRLQGVHKGEIFRLPPDTQALKEAQPGEYRLHATGDIVINPDLIVTYEINSSHEK